MRRSKPPPRSWISPRLGGVYDGIGTRYGLVGKTFNFFSKLRGGMQNNVALELRAA